MHFSFHCGTFPLYFKVNALWKSLNLNSAISSFIAASLRIMRHSKTWHYIICLLTKTLYLWCEPSILIVVVVAQAGLFKVRQIREWATYIYFFFTLRYVTAPFHYLSHPPRPPLALALALAHSFSGSFAGRSLEASWRYCQISSGLICHSLFCFFMSFQTDWIMMKSDLCVEYWLSDSLCK